MIREIDKGSEEEHDEVVEVNRSNVKRWYKDPLNEREETSLDKLDLYTIFFTVDDGQSNKRQTILRLDEITGEI